MTRLRWVLLAGAVLGAACGGKTTAQCDAACDIWANCQAWDRAVCMSQCKSDGDWDKAYVDCLRAQTCQTLDACG
jgi:hypothetical protein